ncbi:MAG TPA: alpha/beta family hydrolase [Terriglobales bacterium]|nr:alpha/beta family hydrolase [Terriglobales bacterium]
MPSEIRSFFLDGPAGKLEALLNVGKPNARYAALVCHPHPLFGGTMHNKVVYHAMKALNGFGIPVLRFNFRGAGLSEGVHDEGRGERDDVRAALDWLAHEYAVPIIFAGFSFGAATGMKTTCPDPRVVGIISLGTPVAAEGRMYAYHFLAICTKPKLMISGDHDQYGPLTNLREVFAQAAEPKELVIVEDADHFFEGHLPKMRAAIESWLPRQFPDLLSLNGVRDSLHR